MKTFYKDDNIELYCGSAIEVLQTLPDEYVDCVMTSPPYWALRDYGIEGQLGLEPTFTEYVNKLCDIFDESDLGIKSKEFLLIQDEIDKLIKDKGDIADELVVLFKKDKNKRTTLKIGAMTVKFSHVNKDKIQIMKRETK